MRQALIINRCNSYSFVINIKDIIELDKEDFFNSGIILFFDKDFELILWGSSYEDVLSLAKDMVTEEVYGYYILQDADEPLTMKEIDDIYDGLNDDIFSIIITNRNKKMEIQICLN